MTKNYTIKDISEGLAKKEFSAEEILSHYSNKIGLENKKLNAYLSTLDFQNSKFKIQNSSLAGVPAAIKDNMLIDGTVATAGSKILENYTSAYDATVIDKLKKAGVQFLGKTNMDEFAMGSSVENSAFGPTKNPHDLERVPGGSSGGSAAAVAADLCVFALGSDTGGSIRQPASFCGVVGLKPTYGRVSRHGLIAMSSSLDQIGPITKNVYDTALVLNTICGQDKFDSTTVSREVPDFTKNLDKSIKGLRVGVPKEYFTAPTGRQDEGLSSEVRISVQNYISELEKLGCEISEISLPHSEYALAVYYIIMPSEVSSNLARFDGIRYGHSSQKSKTLLEVYENSRSEGFGAEPKRRIMLGTFALSSGYYDAYYLKAQKVRSLIKKDFDNAFGKVDIIVGPTAPTTAFKIGEKSGDPLSMYLSDIYTVPVNLAGLPAISIPCGKGSESGLLVGFQIIANSFDEETLLRVAYQLENKLKS
ncbi:MAG: aspartyl/glutamyl-tRNA amidotransferase subunit A [Candidatus Yanofskybacteria bacterium RIFCSPHIGHO2_02_FULL_38_22b]|uniref:Glutamyl-tRNA(Gln) amidotransferase subunit A n=1 Tax=Candidatus Yanofskybacteria bacterium RIFCSPHIGHO2_02_FULL_38_22b TaxID=1802673 RepID=A0A1F8F1I1_9BACT|nr:MAG: aspartyl/glutamyl-tRNA amidotransferase subunit A [Candidatus Yanofskybacteria bacterium RIFCSPHIGHO2_01_FULL_39_44]OGN06997.1 MAG: aspartyl/glutamyl-tRNA amidotransferase subunit A [Candidatus Yanofskybacteria bacterium RIFCSPHIGHO2_02_FULL_38_22b]